MWVYSEDVWSHYIIYTVFSNLIYLTGVNISKNNKIIIIRFDKWDFVQFSVWILTLLSAWKKRNPKRKILKINILKKIGPFDMDLKSQYSLKFKTIQKLKCWHASFSYFPRPLLRRWHGNFNTTIYILAFKSIRNTFLAQFSQALGTPYF